MITRRILLFSLVALAACREPEGPLDPVWGKQACEHCKMLVSQRATSAQIVVGGEHYWFDDVGCMVQWLDERHTEGHAWVRLGDRWVDAEGARYSSGATTPMDHGFVANASGDVDWSEMRKRIRAKGGSP